MFKIAVAGSRNLEIDLENYLPKKGIELISGGAKGIDTCARRFAEKYNLKITEYLPEYEKYGKAAPIYRNHDIVDNADKVLVFWDAKSRGTSSVISYCEHTETPIEIVLMKENEIGPIIKCPGDTEKRFAYFAKREYELYFKTENNKK